MKNLMLVVFLLLFSFSVYSQTEKPENQGQGNGRGSGIGSGIGSGTGSGTADDNQSTGENSKIVESKPAKNSALRLLSKPKPSYTDLARQNQVQGRVILQVSFLKNGEIGKIKILSGLPHGLTEQATAAAKKIKFEPERKNGKPKTVKKKVEYNFTIY